MGNYNSKDDARSSNGIDDHSIPARSGRSQAIIEPVVRVQEDPYSSSNNNSTTNGIITIDTSTDNLVPTVFKWEHGGKHVYITGTFNNWEKQIPMHRSGNDFTYVHNLKRGKHAFKFIVDDEWRYAPDQPTIADVEGQINNFIDVSDFAPYTGDDNFFIKSKDRKVPNEEFQQAIPDLDEYTKE